MAIFLTEANRFAFSSLNRGVGCHYRQNSAIVTFVNGASNFVYGAFVFINGASVFVNGASNFIYGAFVFINGASVFVNGASKLLLKN